MFRESEPMKLASYHMGNKKNDCFEKKEKLLQ